MPMLFKRGLTSPGRVKRPKLKTLLAVGLTSSTIAFVASSPASSKSNLIVQTDEGRVQGFLSEGVTKFLGIPYAEPPVGNLRWMPPVKHKPWKYLLNATAYAPHCAQAVEGPFEGPINNHEDCLYLNIFAPEPGGSKGEKMPVMFWSYGGGDADGESNDYDGSTLANRGHVVVVTFNYRMNLIGFLAHPALDNEGHLFGNYGLLDNQLALRWVHDNIVNFGGDPKNVTILGQSGGSRNTASEVVSPLVKGLFHRAIFESGAIPLETPLSVAEQHGINFAIAAGCGSGATPAVARCLRALPTAKIESFAKAPYITGLIIDGHIRPLPAIEQYRTGNFNHVPILDGDTLNEGGFSTANTEYAESPRKPLTEEQFQAAITTTFSGNAGPGGSPPAYPPGTVEAVLAHYPLSNYPSPQQQWMAEITDAQYTCPTRHVNHVLASQVPLYSYEFRDQTAPFYFPKMPGFVSLAYHTSDIQYYWHLFHGGPLGTPHPLNPKQTALSDQMIATWTNFAWTGNPNGQGNSPWPRYTPDHRVYFTEDIAPVGVSTETDAFWAKEHQCDFWDKVLVYQSTVK